MSPQICSIKEGQAGGWDVAGIALEQESRGWMCCEGGTCWHQLWTQPSPRVLWRAGQGRTQPRASLAAVPGAGAAASTLPLHPRTSPTALLGTWGWNNPRHPQTPHQALLYSAFAVSVPSEPLCLPWHCDSVPASHPARSVQLCLPNITNSNGNPGIARKRSWPASKSVQASMKISGRFCA